METYDQHSKEAPVITKRRQGTSNAVNKRGFIKDTALLLRNNVHYKEVERTKQSFKQVRITAKRRDN